MFCGHLSGSRSGNLKLGDAHLLFPCSLKSLIVHPLFIYAKMLYGVSYLAAQILVFYRHLIPGDA